jgi:hypothetical protein
MKSLAILMFCMACTASSLYASEVDVVKVTVQPDGSGTYLFAVTLLHDDTGWDHYADRWEILNQKGEVLASRVLMHPHVQEQPFTRSLSGVSVPKGIDVVTVRGHDSVHDYGGKEVSVAIPR